MYIYIVYNVESYFDDESRKERNENMPLEYLSARLVIYIYKFENKDVEETGR